MDERVMQFRVGVMVLATLIITAILLVIFGKLPKLVGNYTVQVSFDNAGGITKDTPVRKSGVLIGRVADVQLIENDQKVLVTLNIQTDKTLYRDEDCFINRDLLGDTAVVFAWSKAKAGLKGQIDRSKILEGTISDDPTGLKRTLQGPIDTVENTGRALADASKQLGAAAKRVEDILNPEAQQNVQDILHDAAASLKVVQKVLGDEKNQTKLSEALSRLPDTLNSINQTLETFTKPTGEGTDRRSPVERMVHSIDIVEHRLDEFSKASDPNQIAKTVENIKEITDLMRTIMSRIEQGDGSLGALLNDRQLYDRLNRTAGNLEQISCRLKPIVDDARVFSDKIARHPGVIVRDAVKPGTGVK